MTSSPRQANHLHRCSATSILPVPLSCTECLDQTESVVSSANWPPSFLWERDDLLCCHDLGVGNASFEGAALNRIVVVARSHLRRLASENSDLAGTVAVEIPPPPCALKFEVSRQGEIARFEALQFFGHIHNSTFIARFMSSMGTSSPMRYQRR